METEVHKGANHLPLPSSKPGLPAARRWIGLAVTALLLSGLLALLLVVGRLPGLAERVADPLFFKRGLVVHVDLALIVWFYAYLGGLHALLPSRRAVAGMGTFGFRLAVLGVLLLVAGFFLRDATPVLANYVPVLDHPLYLCGLACFALGLALQVLDGRILAGSELPGDALTLPEVARPGIRAAGLAFLTALLTFGGAILSTPGDLAPQPRFELWFWGGGHVLQVASTAAMVAVWLTLLTRALGRAPVSRPVAAGLFALLVLPTAVAPLWALRGTVRSGYLDGFTDLMRWGIFPIVLVFLALAGRALAQARRDGRLPRDGWKDARLLGLFASATLTLVGYALGAAIRGPSTLVPAHYHANIGAVTASFMTLAYVLVPALGLSPLGPRAERLAKWQPVVFGGGQLVFAIGFGLAGVHGAARKAYGSEQIVRTTAETFGLWIMGLGGLVAIVGGLLFLGLMSRAWWQRPRTADCPPQATSVSGDLPAAGTV